MLYRDALMIVLDKPAGMAVHRGPKGGASLEDSFDALRFGLPRPPALAHRLDRETSGCLVLGRHRKALAHLGALFRHGRVGKTYWAIVEGGPEADAGEIDLALGRLDATRGWWMKPDAKGLPARTRWRVLGRADPSPNGGGLPRSAGAREPLVRAGPVVTSPRRGESLPRTRSGVDPRRRRGSGERVTIRHAQQQSDPPHPIPLPSGAREEHAARAQPETAASSSRDGHFTWLALEPLTGRTHQLRVHCAEMGFPIVGDAIYGHAPRYGGPPLHLHAAEVVVPLYPRREPIRVTAPVPAHMRELLMRCGWKETR